MRVTRTQHSMFPSESLREANTNASGAMTAFWSRPCFVPTGSPLLIRTRPTRSLSPLWSTKVVHSNTRPRIIRSKTIPSASLSPNPSEDAKPKSKLLFGFDPSPELAAILSVYFVQGALGISRLAITFFLKDELSLTPAQVSAFTGISLAPWLIKPIYGFLTDSFPIFGYRRRSYLICAGALGVASWLSLAVFAHSLLTTTVAVIGTAVSVAVSDVVVDSIVVKRVRNLPAERSGALQSLCWGSAAVGGLLSAYFSGQLLQTLNPRDIFAGTAILPFGTAFLAGLIVEDRCAPVSIQSVVPTIKERASKLFGALSNSSVYLPVLFIFLWQATPSPESALFFFQTNVLHFKPEFLGRVRLAASVASLLGLGFYNTYLRKWPLKDIMLFATLVSVPLALTQLALVTRFNVTLGISDQLFALTDTAVLTALGQIAFMPTLVLAARLCPPGVEGTLFAALMSIYNASGVASNELGALLTSWLGISESNFEQLPLLIVVCTLSSLLPLPLLNLMDRAPPDVSEKQLHEQSNLADETDDAKKADTVSSKIFKE